MNTQIEIGTIVKIEREVQLLEEEYQDSFTADCYDDAVNKRFDRWMSLSKQKMLKELRRKMK